MTTKLKFLKDGDVVGHRKDRECWLLKYSRDAEGWFYTALHRDGEHHVSITINALKNWEEIIENVEMSFEVLYNIYDFNEHYFNAINKEEK